MPFLEQKINYFSILLVSEAQADKPRPGSAEQRDRDLETGPEK